MARYALSTLLAIAISSCVFAQAPADPPEAPPAATTAAGAGGAAPPPAAPTAAPPAAAPPAPVATPLASKHFDYPAGIPYKADTDQGTRGLQFGYNLCNSTTEGPASLCQTAFVNSIDDFCIWAPSKPNSLIADTEGETVAWCTKPGRGTRLIPAGALTGVQFMKTPDYLQVVGFIDQTKIDIAAGDSGGEMDPHGADLRGNPLGGLMYSNGFPSNNGNNATFQQVIEWHNFMGGNAFCMKVCDPAGANAAHYCEHIYDRIGCAYNAPNAAQNNQFVSCQGENQDFPGVFTSGGVVQTYTQPAESLGPIATIPYTARIPASSNCVSFQSASIYTGLPTVSSSATSTGSGAAATGTGKNGSGGGTSTGTAGSPGASGTKSGGAMGLTVSGVSGLAGIIFAIVFLS